MAGGGRTALWETILSHLESQQRYERSARLNGLSALLLVIPIALASVLAKQNGNPQWQLLQWLAIATPLLALVQWGVTRSRIERLHSGAEELRGYIHNVLFGYEIWYDLIADDAQDEYRLGPIELAKVERSFKHRVLELFKTYPQLAEKKYLEPFPGWYRKMYRSGSQRNNQYVDHFWQYALAQVLSAEFFAQH